MRAEAPAPVCSARRSPDARSIDVTVDGAVAATFVVPPAPGPTDGPTVAFTNDRSAVGQPACAADACRFVDVSLAGFEAGTEVTVTCHGETVGAFSDTPVVIGPDGAARQEACYFGYAGKRFWVDAGGVSSEVVIWPEG